MKTLFKILTLFILLTATPFALGAGTSDNEFIMGRNSDTLERRFCLNKACTNMIRVPNGGGDLEFSNDAGSNFKTIGSGGGGAGGVNLLADFDGDFEGGLSNWTASGGSFTEETANPLFGARSAKMDFSSNGQTLDSTLVQIESGFIGKKCSLDIEYRYPTGVVDEIKLIARHFDDSLSTESDVAVINLPPTTGSNTVNFSTPFFDCPDDEADSLRVRLEAIAADPQEITIDNVFNGTGKNTFQITQNTLMTQAYFPAAASCVWSINNAAFTDYGADGDCSALTIVSNDSIATLNTPSGGEPALDYTFLPEGKYKITATFTSRYNISAIHEKAYRISDGTSFGPSCGNDFLITTGATGGQSITCSMVVTSTGGAKKFIMQTAENAGGSSQIVNAAIGQELVWTVERFPINSAQAVTLETVGEYWDVNIGGANPGLGLVNESSYRNINDVGLDMVINPGSKSASIPCAGVEVGVGLTCSSGAEHLGIVIDTTTSGRYRICSSYSHRSIADVAGSVNVAFQWVETPNNALTILQEGKSRPTSGADVTGGSATGSLSPMYLCGDFIFSTSGKKTLRLYFEQTIGATVTVNDILIDRGTAVGQRDLHITVDKMDQQMTTPIFTDLTNSLNAKVETPNETGMKLFSVLLDTTTDTVSREYGAWIASVSNIGAGRSTMTLVGGTFSEAPNCTCSVDGPIDFYCVMRTVGSTSLTVRIYDPAGVLSDEDTHVVCHGK